jgi:hypothetical protein
MDGHAFDPVAVVPLVRSSELLGFSPNARVLIVNADDFGMYHAVNCAAGFPSSSPGSSRRGGTGVSRAGRRRGRGRADADPSGLALPRRRQGGPTPGCCVTCRLASVSGRCIRAWAPGIDMIDCRSIGVQSQLSERQAGPPADAVVSAGPSRGRTLITRLQLRMVPPLLSQRSRHPRLHLTLVSSLNGQPARVKYLRIVRLRYLADNANIGHGSYLRLR